MWRSPFMNLHPVMEEIYCIICGVVIISKLYGYMKSLTIVIKGALVTHRTCSPWIYPKSLVHHLTCSPDRQVDRCGRASRRAKGGPRAEAQWILPPGCLVV